MSQRLPASSNDEVIREIRSEDGRLLFRILEQSLVQLEFLVREAAEDASHPNAVVGGLVLELLPARNDSARTLLDFVPIANWQELSEVENPPAELLKSKAPSGQTVAGIYRTHAGLTVEITDSDRKLLRAALADRSGLLMLVHAEGQRARTVHIYTGTSSDLSLVCRFPLLKPTPAWRRPGELAEVPRRDNVAPYNGGMFARKSPAMLLALGVSGLVVLAGAGLLGFAIARMAEPRDPLDAGPVKLSMTARGSRVELTWNAESAIVRNAIRGSLVIVDNTKVNRFELTPSELLTGKYEYIPVRGDLTCQILLYQPDHTFSGETEVFVVPASAYVASAPISRPDDGSNPSAPLPSRTLDAPAVRVPPLQTLPPVIVSAPPAVFSAPPAPTRANRSTVREADAPPEVGVLPQVAQSSPVVLPGTPPRAAAPMAESPATRPAPLQIERTDPPAASIGRRSSAQQSIQFAGPVPVKQVNPAIPSSVRSVLRQSASIRLLVQVDAEGKVIEARPLSLNGPIEKLLAPHAAQAARLWRFQPARRDGVAVASETIIQFEIKP